MEEKTTKYFMAGTDEEVFVGDVINTEVVKDFKDGRKITRQIEFELSEETIPLALELGIIEEDEEDDLIDFDSCDMLSEFREAVANDIDELNGKIQALEDKVKVLEAFVSQGIKEGKNGSSKKK